MKPSDASAATSFMTLLAILAERLFGSWVRRVSPATLRADAPAWGWRDFMPAAIATPALALRTVGTIATPWPRFELPSISWTQASDLVGLAFALTIVALGQDISIAKTVALRSGQRIDANREFRGQGLSNIIGGFFSCYVSCGSMKRSMPNLEAGARTPLSSVFAALTLLDIARWRQLFALSRTDFGVAPTTLPTSQKPEQKPEPPCPNSPPT